MANVTADSKIKVNSDMADLYHERSKQDARRWLDTHYVQIDRLPAIKQLKAIYPALSIQDLSDVYKSIDWDDREDI